MSFQDSALPLITKGIRVVPVQPLAKVTYMTGSHYTRGTFDREQILAWDRENPSYNAGALGSPDGVVVLDCDVIGLRALIEKETGQKFPPTYMVKSANKGTAHVYFKQTDFSRELGNQGTDVADRKYDLRGDNQYVVAANSEIICDDGSQRTYKVMSDLPIADFPDWLGEWILKNNDKTRGGVSGTMDEPSYVKLRTAYYEHLDPEDMLKLEDLTIGSLHPTLKALAFLLREEWRTQDEIEEALQAVGERFGWRKPRGGECAGLARAAMKKEPHGAEPRRGVVYNDGKHCILCRNQKQHDEVAAEITAGTWVSWEPEGGFNATCTQEEWDLWVATQVAAGHKIVQLDTAGQSDGFKFPKVLGGKVSDFMLLPFLERFDGWFGRGRVGLIVGASHSGKTTFMIPTLLDQWEGRKVFGHDGAGLQPLVIFADRGKFSNEETLLRMNLTLDSLPLEYISMCVDDAAIAKIKQAIEKQSKLPQVVFVEGADALISNPSDSEYVARFMGGIQKISEHYHIAFILSIGSPKMKSKDNYASITDTAFGSEKWTRMADMFLKMTSLGDGTTKYRKLTAVYRNAGSVSFDLEFGTNGRLGLKQEVLDPEELKSKPEPKKQPNEKLPGLEEWALRREWFTRKDAAELGSKSAVNRGLLALINENKLETRLTGKKEELRLRRPEPKAETFSEDEKKEVVA